jgi:hypothetical protein
MGMPDWDRIIAVVLVIVLIIGLGVVVSELVKYYKDPEW